MKTKYFVVFVLFLTSIVVGIEVYSSIRFRRIEKIFDVIAAYKEKLVIVDALKTEKIKYEVREASAQPQMALGHALEPGSTLILAEVKASNGIVGLVTTSFFCVYAFDKYGILVEYRVTKLHTGL